MFSAARAIQYRVQRTLDLALSAGRKLSDDQLKTPAGPSSPAIGWHFWHMARWTDRIRARLDNREEIWREKGLATLWGWDPSILGSGESGMEMEEKNALALPIPTREQLIEYVEECSDDLNRFMTSVNDADLDVPTLDFYGREVEFGAMLLNHLSHMDRHLGMIEALRGTAGLRGSATV